MHKVCISLSHIFLLYGTLIAVILNDQGANMTISECVEGGYSYYVFLISTCISFFPLVVVFMGIKWSNLFVYCVHSFIGIAIAVSFVAISVVTKKYKNHDDVAYILFVTGYVHAFIGLFHSVNIFRRFLVLAATFTLASLIFFRDSPWKSNFEWIYLFIFSLYITTYWKKNIQEKKERKVEDINELLLKLRF